MVTVCSWARPCSIPVMFSERVSFHRTGRPVCRASQHTSANSGSAPIFAPNPPPTSGVIRCTAEASTPSQPATSSRAMCAFWVEAQRVNRPSSPHTADAALVSSGHGASRWLTISWVSDDLAVVEQVLVELLVQAEAVGGVGARLLEQQHLVRRGGAQVDHRRQRVVVDLDQVGGVLPLVGLLGQHGGHRLADEAHLVGGQPGPDHAVGGHREQLGRDQVDVGAGEHGHHAGRPSGLLDVHGGDPRVREWGPDQRQVQRTGQPIVGQVIGVGGAPREEHRVLVADYARAHDAHRRTTLVACAATCDSQHVEHTGPGVMPVRTTTDGSPTVEKPDRARRRAGRSAARPAPCTAWPAALRPAPVVRGPARR